MSDMNGVDEFTLAELEELFKDEVQPESPTVGSETDPQEDTSDGDKGKDKPEETKKDVDKTKAFAKRLKESTDKARQEEREAIAKSLGYESYEKLQKAQQDDLLKEKGIDPEIASDTIDEIVKKRLEEDPRLKELNEFKKQKLKEFGEKELAEISKLTNGEVNSFSQLSKEVIDLWTKKGSLKAAYLELEGEKLINKFKGEQSRGSTSPLASPTGSSTPGSNKRPLTEAEKQAYRIFNPGMSEEELNKLTMDIK